MNRRTFLKIAGIGSVSFAFGCDPPPKNLFSLVKAPDDMVVGEATWYASTCRECPAGCGILPAAYRAELRIRSRHARSLAMRRGAFRRRRPRAAPEGGRPGAPRPGRVGAGRQDHPDPGRRRRG